MIDPSISKFRMRRSFGSRLGLILERLVEEKKEKVTEGSTTSGKSGTPEGHVGPRFGDATSED